MGPQKFHKNKKVDAKPTNKSKKNFKQFRDQPRKGVKEDDEIKELKSKYDSINVENITLFKDLPLSQKTVVGLKKSHYYKPTVIQREAIGYALQGRDVLGAAVTGSGKIEFFMHRDRRKIKHLNIFFTSRYRQNPGIFDSGDRESVFEEMVTN